MASVIPRHIPDPPPVQNNTLPLKISSLKTDVESTMGTTYADGAMVSCVRVSPGDNLLTSKGAQSTYKVVVVEYKSWCRMPAVHTTPVTGDRLLHDRVAFLDNYSLEPALLT
jgi:hypothetical protein